MKNGRKGGKSLGVLILAAGQGTRMESHIPKVLHPVAGRPMLFYVLRVANAMKPNAIGVVIGFESDKVKASVQKIAKDCGITRPIVFITQKKPLGSGHAVLESVSFLKKFQTAAVLCGDTPLLTYESLYALLHSHEDQKGQVTLLTARLANPKGYGRIIRSPLGEVLRIVEESVGTQKELAVTEVNSGAYCFEVLPLLKALKEITGKGPKKEHFLTDVLEFIRSKGGKVNAYVSANPEEILGVNSRVQLSAAERITNRRMLERLMLSGVSIIDPTTTHVDADVEVGKDSVLHPFTILRGKTKIGRNCEIGPYCNIQSAQIGNECLVQLSQLTECRILEKTEVGPYSHIRPDSVIGPRAKIGNFSEIKNARVGYGSKVNHLSYIGDADVAEDVNIGAGTITCNYDGKSKHKTTIGAKTFVGSNVNFIAPVKIGRGAKIAAGSTIDKDVPDQALAIARERQTIKPNYQK